MENRIKVEELLCIEFSPGAAIKILDVASELNSENDIVSFEDRIDSAFTNEEKIQLIAELSGLNRINEILIKNLEVKCADKT